ncbi:DUF2914 domain-containing protein [Marinobacter bohaiensis]|uniref:DUF2914 domain-containing protein n=1 Tax=Marinobacter bohaiensis TaxID=2201898 RepID=UPI000DACE619|nr:DUF2914 domain-containing protein [Marinobacter bohaiensis]
MKEKSDNLRIRAVARDRSNPAQEVVVYHWGRILVFLVIAAVVLVGLGLYLWSWLGSGGDDPIQERLVAAGQVQEREQPDSQSASEASPPESDGPKFYFKPEPVEMPAEVPAEATPDVRDVDPVSESARSPEQSSAPDVAAASGSDSVSTNDDGTEAQPDIGETLPPKNVIDDPAATAPSDDAPAAPEPQATPESTAAADSESVDDTDTASVAADGNSYVEIASDHLARAQLTSALDGREPTDVMPMTVRMGSEDLIRVYYFNEWRGLKGRTVYHDWYRGDERMARVEIDAFLDSMRASSSKRINRQMLGDWHVETVTDSGEVLGIGYFRVTE